MDRQPTLFPELGDAPAEAEPRGFQYREEILSEGGGRPGRITRTAGSQAI